MPKKTSPEDVSVLSSARNGLTYLTANDWALIADKAARLQFKAGEFVVRKGKRTHGVYMLLKGTAAVQLPQGGAPIIGPGEVCGEISFIDELPATVDGLFELFPHLGSRFYRSMASSLSRRLRELISPAGVPVGKGE